MSSSQTLLALECEKDLAAETHRIFESLRRGLTRQNVILREHEMQCSQNDRLVARSPKRSCRRGEPRVFEAGEKGRLIFRERNSTLGALFFGGAERNLRRKREDRQEKRNFHLRWPNEPRQQRRGQREEQRPHRRHRAHLSRNVRESGERHCGVPIVIVLLLVIDGLAIDYDYDRDHDQEQEGD